MSYSNEYLFAVKWQEETIWLSQLRPFQNSANLWVFELPQKLNDDFYNHLWGRSFGCAIVTDEPGVSYSTNFLSKQGMKEVRMSSQELHTDFWIQSHITAASKPEHHGSSPGLLFLRILRAPIEFTMIFPLRLGFGSVC